MRITRWYYVQEPVYPPREVGEGFWLGKSWKEEDPEASGSLSRLG